MNYFKLILQTLACSLCLSMSFTTSAQTFGDIRVGLYYDDTVLTSANLANENGSGYRFGYYENKTDFVELGQTTATSITMVIGSNVYLSGTTFYTTAPSSTASVLGCYHVLHSKGYSSYTQANNVASGLPSGFVAWIDGDFQVRSGAYATEAEAQVHASTVGGEGSIVGTSAYSINIVKYGSTDLIFQFDGGMSKGLGVVPDLSGHADPQTWFKNMVYRGGFHYQRVTRGDLTVSNILPLETYVKGVIPYEMSPSWPVEALKTQAVCARTYGATQILRVNHASENFDLCNSAHCQVYRGLGGPATANPSENSDRAVEETANMFLYYGNSLAGTYYSSSHGGASEAVSNVWRSSDQSQYPYLSGVVDPYEHLANNVNSRSSWNITFTKTEMTTMLQSKGLGVDTEIDYLMSNYSTTGNVISLVVHWTNGKTSTIYPTELRYTSWFALPSIHFAINSDLPEVTNFNGTAVTTTSTPSGYLVNDSSLLTTLQNIFTLTGWGGNQSLSSDPHVITGDGSIVALTPNVAGSSSSSGSTSNGNQHTEGDVTYTLEILSGSHRSSGDLFEFNGAGWGHNIGMSQFGAYAMALHMGYSYDYILEFYFPGTQVRSS